MFLLLLCIVSCSQLQTPITPPSVSETPAIATQIMSPVFTSNTTIESLQKAIKVANCVVRSESFLKEIGSYAKYDYTDMSPNDVESAFRNIKPIRVGTYRTKNPYSKVYATTYASDRETIWINTRKLPRPTQELTNTFIHEGSHLIKFSHGDNSPIGKSNSVPYGVGAIAEKHVAGCESPL
jgi:hypothetical protein